MHWKKVSRLYPSALREMKTAHNVNKSTLYLAFISLALLLPAGTSLAQAAPKAAPADWKTILQQRLPVYGHRNWIVVADSAFPAYSQSGIEMIVADQDLPTVLHYVAHAIASSRHVRATVFLDQELKFVDEKDYPGVTRLRDEITGTFGAGKISSIPHSQVLSKIDDAGKIFRVLFIKTNAVIPYTSVYMRLDCGYMTDEIDKKIQDAIASTNK